MNSKTKGAAGKGDAKTASSRGRPPRDENWKPFLSDSKKKSSVRRDTAEARPKRANNGSTPAVQPKAQVSAAASGWVKGGSSPSFADIVRKKAEAANPEIQEHFTPAVDVPVEEPDVVMTPNGEAEDPQLIEPEIEEIAYLTTQDHAPIPPNAAMHVSIEEEIEETTPIRYYVLEIDRIGEEAMVLPPRITQTATECCGMYFFSGQAGKPPTPPTAQVQPQFYRPETTATRPFSGMTTGVSERGAPWGTQTSPSLDTVNWSLQDRYQRPSHQGIHYNSYGALGQQQQQRSYVPIPANRVRQHEMMSDASLRALRDGGVTGTFNRHPGNSGGLW